MASEDAVRSSMLGGGNGGSGRRDGKGSDGTRRTMATRPVVGWMKRVNSMKMDMGKKIVESKVLGSTEDPSNPGAASSETSALDSINRNFQAIHPLTQMNDHVKERLKDLAKQNAKKIAASIVELGIYTTVFHHTKEGLKRTTRNRKYTGPAVRYASDVVLQTALFGPIFGVLVRLKLPF